MAADRMTALVVRADAAHLPLPDASVDLIVTSPPYFALRSYQDGGEHYAGQIGSEASPQEFLDALWTCTREWMRVLKPAGSLFVNLGDKYAGGGGQWDKDERPDPGRRRAVSGKVGTGGNTYGLKPKSLLGIPWRYAIGCIDQLGLILRAEIVWAKPNGLPESVTDRVRRSHEQWFHFTLQPRYFSAVDEIREPSTTAASDKRSDPVRYTATLGKSWHDHSEDATAGAHQGVQAKSYNPLGKLPGSVWEVPSEPLTVPAHLGVDHFAAFPTAWPKRLILGWSPSGICTACGEGRRPVADVVYRKIDSRRGTDTRGDELSDRRGNGQPHGNALRETTITGYACACPDTSAPTRPSVILDPFGGTGTTAAVASALGRIGISVDLSHDYSRLACWRTTDPATRAKIRGERPPVKQADGQEELWAAS